MNKNVILSMAFLPAIAIAQESEIKPVKHSFSPKAFYRFHDEIGYKYRTVGAGIEYSFFQDEGINFAISGMTNGRNKDVLVESEESVSFRKKINDSWTFYPVLSSKFSSHKINQIDARHIFINKSSLFSGIGYDYNINPEVRISFETHLFRDLHNAVMIHEAESFWGKSYSNHFGAKGKIGLVADIKEKFRVEASGYYAQTFKKCYKEIGSVITFKWAF